MCGNATAKTNSKAQNGRCQVISASFYYLRAVVPVSKYGGPVISSLTAENLLNKGPVNMSATSLRDNNTELSYRVKEIEKAMLIAATLASTDCTLGEKLRKSLMVVLGHFDAKRGSIMLVDNLKKELVVRATTRRNLLGLRQQLESDSVGAWVVRNAKPLNVSHIDEEDGFKARKSSSYSRNSFLSYPIMACGKVLGVFNITDKKKGYFRRNDEVALERFIDRIAVTIENAALMEQLEIEKEKMKSIHKELRKQEELKENLMNMIVHDLKGPIGEIMANLSMLSSAELQRDESEMLVTAQVGGENLLAMVLNILDISKMEEGKLRMKIEELDMQEVVKEKIEQLDALLKLDNKEIKCHFDSGGNVVRGDRSLITRVLANLLNNAINYSPIGGVITIRLERRGGKELLVSVEDCGPGIPEDSREKIFIKFEGSKDDRNRYSTGLGLAFCKMAVNAHGGDIWVESEEGKGSIFRFTLPA